MLHTGQILFIGNNCRPICEEMVELGYVGMALHTVSEAVQWAHGQIRYGKALPDIILCSAYTDDGSAIELYDALVKMALASKPLFIILSYQEDQLLQNKAYKAGIDDYIILPVKVLDLHTRLQNIARFKRAEIGRATIEYIKKDAAWMLFKRIFDVVAAASAIVLLMPLLLLIALLIKSESRGPVIYISKRAGRNYRVFDFYKFRSMRVDADKEIHSLARLNLYQGNAAFIKIKDDPRVTRIGAFLRSTSLDELPQLFNVLKGDMSLIGNRPLPLYEAQHLTTDEWALRFLAPAGMTGLWQVSKRGQNMVNDQDRKHLDARYASTQSLELDYQIFVKTFSALRQYV
jgi:lipopolysaccharide/colanic/teichoic acid biosynthesis glycosyltransferase